MADEAYRVGTSSYQVTGESPESTIEINIKTLDSKIYSLRVNKDIPVPTLKEKLVDVAGVPMERQRLIFRGKVLKDDHLLSEYHLEDGHTLHLVARQPVEGQSPSGSGPEGAAQDNSNQGNDSTDAPPRNRVAQVSHSVLLGTVNAADQGENIVADIGQLVGAVLSSLGIGTSSPSGSASGTPSATASNQATSRAEVERDQNTSGSPVSNSSSQGFAVNNLFQSLHQVPQFPPTGFPSRHMTIPDSLTTLSEFISRMELALQNGGSGSGSSPNNQRDPLNPESLSSSARGLPTPEMLQTVLEQAQQLLRGNATAALSRVAERLEREGTSTDTTVRGQIQAEAMNVGAAMQHLGAMLLELGRTIMTLRMGQSPTDSVVNAGPAVYISSAGPNPIMVQPFPLQANSLLGVPPSPFLSGLSGPIPTRDTSRNVNIHIHAGSPFIPGVSSAAARASSGEATLDTNAQQANANGNGTGNSVPTQGLPLRTVVAAIPARPSAQTSGHVLSVIYPVHVRSQQSVTVPSASAQVSNSTVSSGVQPPVIAVPQPPSQSGTLPTIIEQLSAQVASALAGRLGSLSQSVQSTESTNAQGSQAQAGLASQVEQTSSEASALSGNAQGHNSSPRMQSTDSSCIGGPGQALPDSLSSHLAQDDVRSHIGNVDIGDRESTVSVIPNDPAVSMPRSGGEKLSHESSNDSNNLGERGGSGIDVNSSATTSTGGLPAYQQGGQISNDRSYEDYSDAAATNHTPRSSKGGDSDRPVPLGLLGGLQPKRRGKTEKPVGMNQASSETPSSNQDQNSIASGQQFLNSLVFQSSDVDRENMTGPANPQTSVVGQNVDGLPLQMQGTNGQGQVNAADMMSHVLRTPVFSSLLTGVAEQTGIGSSDDLRSMLEQCTQSPSIRNTLNDFAEQVERQPESIGALFSGIGRGQGGLDFSRMMQQMLPVVSQALGRGSTRSTPASGLQLNSQIQGDDGRSTVDVILNERNSTGDLERAAARIEQHDSPVNVFCSVLESAGHLLGEGISFDDLINTLVSNGELTNEFMRMLSRDLHRRTQTDSGR